MDTSDPYPDRYLLRYLRCGEKPPDVASPWGGMMGDSAEAKDRIQQAIEAAQLYYSEGEGLTQQQIAKRLGLAHSSSVSRLLKFALESGIVKITIDPNAAQEVQRMPTLEERLTEKFSLFASIVVNTSYPTEPSKPFDEELDDRLHQALGRAAADYLLEHLLPRDDHIAVGGGRGPYYTATAVRSFAERPKVSRFADLRITSLTGRMATRGWAEGSTQNTPTWQDADDVAKVLGSSFPNATIRSLNASLASSPDLIDQQLSEGPAQIISKRLWDEDPARFVPRMALLGVGALDGGHRFLSIRGDEGYYQLDPIKRDLRELLELTDRVKVLEGYCPVGDICNHLLYFPPPVGVDPPESEECIRTLIEKLNDSILSITEAHLEMIHKRAGSCMMVVAGGAVKLHAIRSILNRGDIIDVLCTDDGIARDLVEE